VLLELAAVGRADVLDQLAQLHSLVGCVRGSSTHAESLLFPDGFLHVDAFLESVEYPCMEFLEGVCVVHSEVFLFALQLCVLRQERFLVVFENHQESFVVALQVESDVVKKFEVLFETGYYGFNPVSLSVASTEGCFFLDHLTERFAVLDQLVEPDLAHDDRGRLELEVQQCGVHHAVQVSTEDLIKIVAKKVAVGCSHHRLLVSGSLMRSLQVSMTAHDWSTISNL
jgi:hypothetical protein